MKSLTKNLNFFIFMVTLIALFSLQSHTHLSTSLLSILPDGETKEMLENFNKTQNSKILVLSVKGFDQKALKKIQIIEAQLNALPMVSLKTIKQNDQLLKHKEDYKLFIYPMNKEKLAQLDVKKELNNIYNEMSTSFFPVPLDKEDPFALLTYPERKNIKLKNGYLTLPEYGYLSYFQLKSNSLKEHKQLYNQIYKIVKGDVAIKVFSPIFYYVENSNAIRSDVNKIIIIAICILLLLYLFILRDISLLLNTLTTLGTSAMLSIIFITQLYGEVSIFVFVFGVSISSIAIDYMFHHYLHGYYVGEKAFNKEVFFGFLTTASAFFILSFTSFLLIKQISIFSIISLFISYIHFAFIYPNIGFKVFKSKMPILHKSMQFLNAKILLFISVAVIMISFMWIHFDLNLKNLDYDNKSLKQTEAFFSKAFENNKSIAFAIKAETINELIMYAQKIQYKIPSIQLPMATLVSRYSYEENRIIMDSLDDLRSILKDEANKIGFRDGYFDNAYTANKKFIPYTLEALKANGVEILKMNNYYITYGRVDEVLYPTVLQYHFTESLSLKERFDDSMRNSMGTLTELGIVAILIIILLLYFIAKEAIGYGLLFLFFPIAMLSIYAYFTALNILHIFMMFVILAIGIDYAIYLSRKGDALTKEAIIYSLISTFAGFGVLIFSQINALFSMGVVAAIGIVSIFILLVFVKGINDES